MKTIPEIKVNRKHKLQSITSMVCIKGESTERKPDAFFAKQRFPFKTVSKVPSWALTP
jgi:hypothetical protein